MKFIKKLFKVLFNPFSLLLSNQRASEASERFSKNVIFTFIFSVIITAMILAICWFLI